MPSKALLVGLVAGGSAVDEVARAFEDFTQKYGKSYASRGERDQRYAAFEHNYRVVQEKNAQGLPYKLAINEFADQNATEFSTTRLGLAKPSLKWGGAPYLGRHALRGEKAADEIDWVSKGAVTPVKNQKSCGSCWSFSTTGALEGAWQVTTGQLVAVSEQQLIDCDTKSGDKGCKGGLMDYAFTYLRSTAACTEESYPYTATDGNACQSKCDVAVPAGSVGGYKDVDAGDSAALMDALNQQPVSVAIEADQTSFQMYESGVLTAECDEKLDHGVLAVGYGTTEEGLEYWKIKNSWGASWGEDGYVRIQRGERKSDDECGIKDMASYPVVSSSPNPTPEPTPEPTPDPTPDPTPTPGPSPQDHYGKPPCLDDEMSAQIAGASMCVTPCVSNGDCPVAPADATADAKCALTDTAGNAYCALICQKDDECSEGATCELVSPPLGVCAYELGGREQMRLQFEQLVTV